MTQFEGLDKQAILRHVLHVIAEDPAPVHTVPQMLEALRVITGAAAAAYTIFQEPHLVMTNALDEVLVPDETFWLPLLDREPVAIHVSFELPDSLAESFADGLLMPIRVKDELVGIVCLLFTDNAVLTDEAVESMDVVIDGLTIVTTQAISYTRQSKLTRNQNEFIRLVTHDLRSPLTSTQGFASMLESSVVGELNEKQARFVSKILSGIEQLASLVDNIQDAGRYDPETGFYEMERTACDLADLVHEVVSERPIPAEKPGLKIHVQTADDVPIVRVDRTMFQRALGNLVDNAIKYTEDNGSIEVFVRREGDSVLIGVKDDGLGIDPEHQKRIFERHFRVQRREHRLVKGSGLGLFIVKSVAKRHGGQAYVESEVGDGSTFYIRLPLSGANLVGAGGDESDE